MKDIYLKNKLRILRRQFGLTQKDLAQLLGLTENSVAKLESGLRDPSILTFMKYRFIFDHPDNEIVPDRYIEAAEFVHKAASSLKSQTPIKSSAKSKLKHQLFDQILSRITLSQYQN